MAAALARKWEQGQEQEEWKREFGQAKKGKQVKYWRP